MIWVRAGVWVIVSQSICERVSKVAGTLGAAVDMKTENRTSTRACAHRETGKFCSNQSPIGGLVKADFAVKARIGIASADNGNGSWRKIC